MGKKDKDKEAKEGSALDRRGSSGSAIALTDARQHLENSEELFRVSLLAKNEEISQLNDELRASRTELSEEMKNVDRINEQLEQSRLRQAQSDGHLHPLKEKLGVMESEVQELRQKLDTVVLQGDDSEVAVWQDSTNKLAATTRTELIAVQRRLAAERSVSEALRDALIKQAAAHATNIQSLEEELAAERALRADLSLAFSAAEGRIRRLEADLFSRDTVVAELRNKLSDRSS